MIGLALVHHPVRDGKGDTIASALTNIDVHDIARHEIFRRRETDADTHRRARRDDVARQERHGRCQRVDERRDVEDEIAHHG